MSVGTELQAVSPDFRDTTRVPIAQLSPDASEKDGHHVEASVVLMWPYSSSTKCLGLLLAEKDIRLRKSKGQVKVTFHGECAQEVARTHVGIGDSIKLGLKHSKWTRTGEEVSTPGRKLEWDIDIYTNVLLEVAQGKDIASVVNFTAKPSSPTIARNSVVEIAGPTTNGFVDIRKTRLSDFRSAPARRSDRVASGSYLDASLDPFVEDDGYIVGKGRKRTKFARHSGSWRLLDVDDQTLDERQELSLSSPSQQPANGGDISKDLEMNRDIEDKLEMREPVPELENLRTSGISLPVEEHASIEAQPVPLPLEEEEDEDTDRDDFSSSMGPPPLPFPTALQLQSGLSIDTSETLSMVETPVLRPLPSPGLALVSPLIERSGISTGYFPAAASSQPIRDAASQIAIQTREVQDPMPPIQQKHGVDQDAEKNGRDESALSLPIDRQTVTSFENVASPVEHTLQTESENQTSSMLLTSVSEQATIPAYDPTYSEADRARSVDLDALQQQIEESTEHYPDSTPETESEDDDMYGPPVNARAKTGDVDTEDLATQFLEPSSSLPLLPQSSAEHIRPLSTAGGDEGVSEDRTQDLVNTDTAQVAEVDIIGEQEEEHSGDDVTSEEEEDSDAEDFDDVALPEDSRYSSTRTEAEIVAAKSTSRDPDNEYLSSSPPILAVKEVMHDSIVRFDEVPTKSFETNNLAQADGINEVYENESQRIRLRTGKKLPVKSTELQAVSVSSDSSESDESSAGESEGQLNPEAVSKVSVEVEGPLEILRVPESLDRDISEMIDEHIDQELEENITAISRTVEPMSQPPFLTDPIDSLSYMITPEATQQQTTSLMDTAKPVPIDVRTTLPPSPQMTQNLDEQTVHTSFTEVGSPKPESGDQIEPTLPNMAPEKTSPTRRISQRLTRKSLAPERISTEYFTPRRSTRVAQSSPTFTKDAPLIAQTLTSPPRSKMILRSSSPIITPHNQAPLTLPQKVARGISTPLSYYPYLATLHEYFNLQVDVIAICPADSSDLSKAKSGPKDHHTTMFLADTSLGESNQTIRAQIFRPNKQALPVAKRGDVVLLRNMKVQTHKHNVSLLSTESSAWAVFRQSTGQVFNITANGPPIEYDEQERTEAERLLSWWTDEGNAKYSDVTAMAESDNRSRETRSTSPMVTRSQKRKAQTTEDNGAVPEEDEHAENEEDEPEASSTLENTHVSDELAMEPSSPPVPVTRQNHRRTNSRRSESVVHELRDGFKWVDDDGRHRSPGTIHQLRDGSTYIDD